MATPPRPTADTIISSAWGTAVHDKVFTHGWTSGTYTTDANGFVNIPAASFGLSNIVSGVASANNVGQPDVHFIVGEVWPNGGGTALAVRCVQLNTSVNGWQTLVSSGGIKVSAVAWGTAGTLRDEAELLPGPDDRPELNPQQES